MSAAPRKKKPDAPKSAAAPNSAAEVIDKLSPKVEPPPMSRPMMSPPYAFPIPFGEPPAEPVELVDGEIPWDLRDGEEPSPRPAG